MSTAAKSTSILRLNTGVSIPQIGLGTWQSTEEEVYGAVLAAIKAGYKHIDTAAIYKNETAVGRAIKDSGIPREELFVTTKLWCTYHTRVQQGLDESLERLGLEYVDLYLIHWPFAMNPNGADNWLPFKEDGVTRDVIEWDYVKTYEAMQELLPSGKVRAIGISNFTEEKIERLLNSESTKIKPACLQIELHPLLPQQKLIDYCKSKDIVVEAYSPLGSTGAPLLKNEKLIKIAEKYGVSPATICISWAIWRGTVVLPKSVSSARIESNLVVVKLDDEDGEQINSIHETEGVQRFVSPKWGVPVFD
ncbi:unnamed protein product [[Candida] boidinii]|uniref:Unnamed protein product n=1 Tax=Candida boidinii TaxID=5477 RepID=A0ACB5TEV4_CANBO|nr:unnamed protein product [[Candida] boidinii]GME87239.1 unnamed protein product [[Candida] boidinii]GME99392.1 unnamed protein product [[Candida] boidinii]